MDVDRIICLDYAVGIFGGLLEIVYGLINQSADAAAFAHTDMVCDGMDAGLTETRDIPAEEIHELADLAVKLGAKTAYNMDGGYSTLLYFNGKRLNETGNKSPRNLMDIIYFASAR